MESSTIVRKHICMRELQVTHAHYSTYHFFDAGKGKENSSFGFVTKGSLVLNSINDRIEIPTGSLFYIPEGQRYHSIWTGDPDIEFYGVHIVWNQLNAGTFSKLAMQYIPQFSNRETLTVIQQIESLLRSEDRADRIRGVGLYYQWYASIYPHLKTQTARQVNPVLLTAMDYIHENYTTECDIASLAKHCHVSESRLYHLFQSEIKSTPVQYKNTYRIEKAAQILSSTNMEIDDVAISVGYNSVIYFREVFKRITGMTPSAYRSTTRNVDVSGL